MMAERPDAFAQCREEMLERAQALNWPEVIMAGIGRIGTEAAWIAAVELGTGDELIALNRALLEAAA